MIWNGQGKVDYSLRQQSIRRECEASLRRFKTNVIDLYQIHWTADDLNETLEGWTTLAALQKEGKVLWIGDRLPYGAISAISLAAKAILIAKIWKERTGGKDRFHQEREFGEKME
jgi:aryl-alcohol dehydrogenase-like predicted oxidoreductase